MAISALTNINVSPETLFREGYNNGMYWGDGFSHEALNFLGNKHGMKVTWTNDINAVYDALLSHKGIFFHVKHNRKYKFTKEGHYIFLYGSEEQNDLQKAYVFDPKGSNNYIMYYFL